MKYIQYTLTAEEPMKMGASGNQANNDSFDYILGSSLRGAFIGAYIKEQNFTEDDVEKRKSQLFREIYFTNAYLQIDGKAGFPMPFVFYADKHDIRTAEREATEELSVHSLGNLDLYVSGDDKPAEGEQRVAVGSFIRISENSILSQKVRKISNLHVSVKKDSNPDGAMYRYEAVAAGQSFVGYIRLADELAEGFRNVIDGKTFHIGGAKSGGYGRCHIGDVRVMSYEEMFAGYGIQRQKTEQLFSVYAMSNLCLYNENGQVTGQIPEKYLEEKLHIRNVKLLRAYVGAIQTGGYNQTWRTGGIQETGIAAGSYFVYSCEGDLKEDAILDFESAGVGVRKQEGFGRILINPDFSQKKLKRVTAKNEEKSEEAVQIANLSKEQENILSDVAKRVNRNRIRENIYEDASGAAESNRQEVGQNGFTMSKITKFYLMLHHVASDIEISDNDAKKQIRLEVEKEKGLYNSPLSSEKAVTLKLREKKISLGDIFEDLRNDNKKASAWMKHTANLKDEKNLLSFGTGSTISEFRLKLLFLEELFYDLMRKEGGAK